MKKRFKEIEEEAGALREMQGKVEKEMASVQAVTQLATSSPNAGPSQPLTFTAPNDCSVTVPSTQERLRRGDFRPRLRRAISSARDNDGPCLQMKLAFSPAVDLFSFLFPLTDCRIAGALALLRIFIYMTFADSKTTMCVQERKASIKQFYDVLFPSILQLQSGITDLETKKQKEICSKRYSSKDGCGKRKLLNADVERETECGIFMETNTEVLLPNCSHSLCLQCFRDWYNPLPARPLPLEVQTERLADWE